MPVDKEPLEVEIKGSVQTNTDNPWRTRGDYMAEQKQLMRAFRWSIAASVSAIITVICTLVLAYAAISELSHISQQLQSQQAQEVQQLKEHH